MGLRLSSRCRLCRTERWRTPMTASRIPPEPASFTSPIIDCEPPPVGITACPPPSPAALHRRTPRPSPCPSGGWAPSLRGECPQRSGAPRPLAAPRGGGVRRRGAAPRDGGRGPAQAHRPIASAGGSRAHRHGHRVDASAAYRRRDATTSPAAHGRRRGGRGVRLLHPRTARTRRRGTDRTAP